MLLADLDLSLLSDEVIRSLIDGLQHELLCRKALAPRQKRSPAPPHKIRQVQKRLGCRTYEDEIAHQIAIASSGLYALPQDARHGKLKNRLRYLPILCAQDWTSLFPHADAQIPEHYVYAHIDPRKNPVPLIPIDTALNGEPFYIGKGSGQRAWDLKRNQGHGKRITALRQLGHPDTALVSIITNNLTEQGALILEAKLIYFFGSIYDEAALGCLLNLADHMRPIFAEQMKRLFTLDGYHHYLQRIGAEAIEAKTKKRLTASVS